MLETIRAWLNSHRDYFSGVLIYSQVSVNEELLAVLRKGKNPFREKRLLEELLQACNNLKQISNYDNQQSAAIAKTPISERISNTVKNKIEIHAGNATLLHACLEEANEQYKKTMNARAILFKLAEVENFQDPNTKEKIQDRAKLAIQVVENYNRTSQLYEKADYVRAHGRLPNTNTQEEEMENENLPDYLVKQRLDNARKAHSKLKSKPTTPERVAALLKHQTNITKLAEQWASLKPKK